MPGFDLLGTVQFILAILLAITVHEASHAFSAELLGDRTAKALGRVTLNPVAHLDPMGTIMLLISAFSGYGFGWGKPVPINPYNLRRVGPKTGMALSAFAGPLANLVTAGILSLPLRLDIIPSYGLWEFILILAMVNVFLALFNLIPIPPLDGFSVLLGFLPNREAAALSQLTQYGPLLLLLLVFAGMRWLGPLLSQGAFSILRFYIG
ncbi:MAG: site-2 protease family protein [Chloroflexota bacterium]